MQMLPSESKNGFAYRFLCTGRRHHKVFAFAGDGALCRRGRIASAKHADALPSLFKNGLHIVTVHGVAIVTVYRGRRG